MRYCFFILASLLAPAACSFAELPSQYDTDYSVNKNEASLLTAVEVPMVAAEVFSFAKAVGSGMVLAAAPKQAMIWGFCPAGAKVEVGFGGETVAATVGPDQATGVLTTWRVLLPATTASFAKHNITATSAGTSLTLSDVMFGEVWVCSGQSNMQYPIGSPTCWNASNINCTDTDSKHNRAQCGYGCVENAGVEIAAMSDYDDGMRLFQVGSASNTTPVAEMKSTSGWLTPSKMGGGFSATCWFFGRDVYAALSPKVPVGLIETNVGGTPDQHWSSPDAMAQCRGSEPWDWPANYTDSVLWNGMVVPLLRTVHSGTVWYQGEANSGADGRQYNCSFHAMISDWRAKFHKYTDGATALDFPFGWAQLNSDGVASKYLNPVFDPKSTSGEFGQWQRSFAALRLAQTSTLSLANTFQAVILDTPVASGSIHSPFKQPVGQRLARGGLAVAYGMKALHAVDPVARSVKVTAGTLVVSVGGLGSGGLTAKVGAEGFEVLGNCSATTLCWQSTPISAASPTSVTLAKLPAQPRAVRYLWYISPCGVHPYQCPVYAKATPIGKLSGEDQAFLPLAPFIMAL